MLEGRVGTVEGGVLAGWGAATAATTAAAAAAAAAVAAARVGAAGFGWQGVNCGVDGVKFLVYFLWICESQ